MTKSPVLLAALAVAFGAAPASAADDVIKIGALLSVSGPASFLGAPESRTLEMLTEQLNAKGGVGGKKIKLIVKDTAGDPAKAVSFAKQLIDEEQVFAIIGPATSGETMQVKAIAEEAKTPLLSCAAAEAIVNPVARYVFKTAQKDKDAITLVFAQMKKMKATEIAVLSSNTGFGKAGKELINKLAAEQGISIVMDETYDKAATDLTAEVTKVKASGAKALLNWSIEPARYVFKTAQKDKDAITLIFAQMKKMKATEIAVLSSNTGFGKAGKELINKLAAEQGISIVMDETYDKAATDLTAEVTKVKASGAKALLNWSIEPAQSIVIKNARQIGLKIPIFQSHGFANINYVKAAGAAAEGVIFPASAIIVADSLPAKHPQKKLLLEYKKAYETRFLEDASAFGAYAYDAFGILVKAIEASGADREKVRDAIEGLKGWTGASGVFTMSPTDHNGLGTAAFEMVTVKNGKFVLLGK